MLLLKYVLLPALFVITAPAMDQSDVSLKVRYAGALMPPVHTWTPGLVVTEVIVNQSTGAVQTRPLHGEPPFLSSALDALMQWRFAPPADMVRSRTSITFLFRPPAAYPIAIADSMIRPWMPGEDSPALPQKVIDPGYPIGSLSAGAVILEVHVSAEGAVTGMATVIGVEGLTEHAKAAVKDWRFSPATMSGKAAPSTAYVVISFVVPT
jgi:TonB family protein